MTGPAALTLVATIVALGPEAVTIDRGRLDGLRAGDSGAVFYELQIGQQGRRIEVGRGEVIEASERRAMLRVTAPGELRVGHRVEFQIPPERAASAVISTLAAARGAGQGTEAAFGELLVKLVPEDEAVERRVIELLERRRAARRAPRDPGPPPPRPRAAAPDPAPAARLPGQSHLIGSPLEETLFYNQHPRFKLRLAPFEIDLWPVSREQFAAVEPGFTLPGGAEGLATGVAWGQAERYCRARGARLPTEFEWEVAAASGRLERFPPILEWTSSWYLPYPGNRVPEPAYGRSYRVLRGSTDAARPEPRRRRYLDPAKGDWRVGFRCASGVAG